MSLILTSEQLLLRDNAHRLVQESAPVALMRRLRDQRDPVGFSSELCGELAQLGWLGAIIPEQYGGAGLGYLELGLMLEAAGTTLAATPIMSSVLLGGAAVLAGGSEAQKCSLLPGICRGDSRVALAFEESARFSPHVVACRAERSASAYKLTGHKRYVLDGHIADTLIVSARTSGTTHDRSGISLFAVDARKPGVKLERIHMIDGRNAAKLMLEAVEVPASALIGQLDRAADIVDPLLDRATIGLAAEMLGMLTRAYEVTLEYLKTRVQFDVLIGSFQALQHRAVDMFCELELAKSVVLDALSAIDDARDDVALMASVAKAKLCDLSRLVTREAVQMHGGIGMTDEHDIGLYLKRAAVAEATFGDSAYHRDRFATLRAF